MRDRIQLLHAMLRNDGTFAVHIDDNEFAYLIAVCDEIFGRRNRLYIITFKQSSVSGPKAINPGIVTIANYIVLYAKSKAEWKPNRVLRPTPRDARYSKVIDNFEEDYSSWRLIGLREALAKHLRKDPRTLKDFLGDDYEEELDKFVLNNAKRVVRTARIKEKDVSEVARAALRKSSTIANEVCVCHREERSDQYFLNGEQLIFYSSKASLIDGVYVTGEVLSNVWDDLLSNNLHNEGGVEFPKGKKPEGLVKRILDLCTGPGDLVLDSFAGSGTTGAVAHKMGRRWIMIELGEHAVTHCVPRLRKVIDGNDTSGVTAAVAWKGGGGFRFCRLAPSLLTKDRFGNWVIAPSYNAAMLAEAVCKLMGFTYAPSQEPDEYWRHGHSTETDFIYVTTQSLTHDALKKLAEEVGPHRTLLICCKAFSAKESAFDNLTIKKIPQTVLSKCEWGRDDYSLRIANLPPADDAPEDEPEGSVAVDVPKRRGRSRKEAAIPLFDAADALGGEEA